MVFSIPERMLQRGRFHNPNFKPTEKLFRRFSKHSLDRNGNLAPSAIAFPKFSINREWPDGQPEDVKRLKPLYGVFQFLVQNLPRELTFQQENQKRDFNFKVLHRPELENFYHSEIESFENGRNIEKEPPKTIKKKFRNQLYEKTKIIISPLDS